MQLDKNKTRRSSMFFAALTMAASLLASPRALSAETVVYAAVSLKESIDAIAKDFEARYGERIVVSYGASSSLAKQIENGAPADVFISADIDWMNYLAQRKLIDPASRKNLLSNRLVLIAAPQTDRAIKIAPGFPLAAKLGNEKLAVANPDAVPAGKYGKAALEQLGIWPAVARQLARTDNVRSALALVSRAEAPYGIVYRTDALADKNVRIVDTFPAESHPPIVYPAALTVTAKKPSANRFLAHLQSEPARAVWQQYGFQVMK